MLARRNHKSFSDCSMITNDQMKAIIIRIFIVIIKAVSKPFCFSCNSIITATAVSNQIMMMNWGEKQKWLLLNCSLLWLQ